MPYSIRCTLVTFVLVLTSCASAPPTSNNFDPDERARADAALDAFQLLAQSDEWYALYVQGEPAGSMTRIRRVKDGQIEIVSTLVSSSTALDGTTITERFDAGAPHDALLLEIREDRDAYASTARIVRTQDGYVGERSRDGQISREPLYQFRYRLADALATEIWMAEGVEEGKCLTYPDYSFTPFKRKFVRECVTSLITHKVSGKPVDAARTRLDSGVRTVRDLSSGRELVTRPRFGVELRLESRSVSTQLTPAPLHRAYAAP